MSKSNLKHLESIKTAIHHDRELSDKEKSLTLQKIEEWIQEDKGMALLTEQLTAISKKIVPILEELGLS